MSAYGNVTPCTVAGVAEQMDKAGALFRRWAGCWIDFLALAALFFLPGLALMPNESMASSGVGFLLLIPPLAYFPVTETLWGRSLGKLVTGLIVVDATGAKPALWRVLVRTVLRLVEVNPFLIGGIPAGICLLATNHKQRIGDLAAGTYVIPYKDLERIRSAPAQQTASLFE